MVCYYFRGWMDWDIEAQQLLRMCQAIRAVQFLYLTTSWLLFYSYCYKCILLATYEAFGTSALTEQRIRLRSCRANTLLVHRVNSLLARFSSSEHITVSVSHLLSNFSITYSNLRLSCSRRFFCSQFFVAKQLFPISWLPQIF